MRDTTRKYVATIIAIFESFEPFTIWLVGSYDDACVSCEEMVGDLDFTGNFMESKNWKIKKGLFGNIYTYTTTIFDYIKLDFTSYDGGKLETDIFARGSSNSIIGFDGSKFVVLIYNDVPYNIVPKFALEDKLIWTLMHVQKRGLARMMKFWKKKLVCKRNNYCIRDGDKTTRDGIGRLSND